MRAQNQAAALKGLGRLHHGLKETDEPTRQLIRYNNKVRTSKRPPSDSQKVLRYSEYGCRGRRPPVSQQDCESASTSFSLTVQLEESIHPALSRRRHWPITAALPTQWSTTGMTSAKYVARCMSTKDGRHSRLWTISSSSSTSVRGKSLYLPSFIVQPHNRSSLSSTDPNAPFRPP